MNNISIIGSGAIATALGNILASKNNNSVKLLSIENEVIESINKEHRNLKYFPNIQLSPLLLASQDLNILSESEIIFLGIPSGEISGFLDKHHGLINKKATIINLAKGFGTNDLTICEYLNNNFENQTATLKGPSFARDIINEMPTGLTLGSRNIETYYKVEQLFSATHIHLDYSNDVKGVELLSILKNIYAIALGIVDAQYDAPNLRFLVFTKAFKEMKNLLLAFGGKEETLFKYCGIGDFGLTSLNDLSRNRTLGLLIGKGFFSSNISNHIVLEGKTAVKTFYHKIEKEKSDKDFKIIAELYKIFNNGYEVNNFLHQIID